MKKAASALSSLRLRNFQLMAASYLVSYTGYWMKYTALIWLVLSLTGSAAEVGLVSALLFLPILVLGMHAGVLADRHPKRRILLFYYFGLTSLTALLAGLTLSHTVQIWHVQLIAAGLGIVSAIGWPAQQAFVGELVGPVQLRHAISITSGVVQLAGLIGPAAAGLLISTVGPGWSILVAAICYTAPLVAVSRIRTNELYPSPLVPAEPGQLRAGLRHAVNRPEILWPTILVGLSGIFTGNLAVTLAVYAKSVYDSGAGGYGLLSTMLAIGSLIGALLSARQHRTRLRTLVSFAAVFSTLYILAAAAPTQPVLCALLLGIGASTLLLQTSAMSTIQLAAHASIRGRIVGIHVLVWSGGIALGGPFMGNIVQYLGPHSGMLLAGVISGIATMLIAVWITFCSRRSATDAWSTSSRVTTRWAASKQRSHGNNGRSISALWLEPLQTRESSQASHIRRQRPQGLRLNHPDNLTESDPESID